MHRNGDHCTVYTLGYRPFLGGTFENTIIGREVGDK